MRSPIRIVNIVIIVLAAIVLLPSVLLSQWFPLDLGGIFEIGHLFREKLAWIISPYNGSGRYFPFYWLFNSLQYFFFATNPLPYFAVQAAILLLAIWLNCRLLQKIIGNSKFLILLAICLFINSPIAENSSTLGKAEPLAYLLAIGILYLFLKSVIAKQSLNLKSHLVICVLFSVALLTKETSLALVGFAMVGLILSMVISRLGNLVLPAAPKEYLKLLISLLIGWSLTKIPYLIFWDPTDLPTYLDYKITTTLLASNIEFYTNQQPDVLLFLLLATGLLGWVTLSLVRKNYDNTDAQISAKLIFVISLYAMGLAYYLVLLVWRWPMAYYMLLPSVIFRFVTVYGLFHLAKRFKATNAINVALYSLTFTGLLYSACYVYYVIGSQISYSRLYTQAILKYAQDSGGKSALVMENYPFYAEQVTGTHLILRFAFNQWFKVGGVSDLFNGASDNSEIRQLLGISDARMAANVASLPVKNDYVLVFTGRKIATWFLRGVTPFLHEESEFEKMGTYDFQIIAGNSISMPSIYFNIWTGKIEMMKSDLGFKLYKVMSTGAKFFWLQRYSDGWIGKDATLLINESFTTSPVLKLSSPNFAIPNSLTITKNGKPFKKIDFLNTDEVTLNLDMATSDTTTYQFSVGKIVTPASIGLNQDERKLGLLVRLE